MEYKEYVHLWLDGIYDEIAFWKNCMETGGAAISKSRWKKQLDKNRRFSLEEDLPDTPEKVIRFADIGSGPLSRCGRITDKCKLEIHCVDPLADVYEILKKENGIDNGNQIQRGFVELLDHQFDRNTFDIVHMSNSLDHCFDPVYGIYQLLYICKAGGKIILRHAENEACNGNYRGLHQWNLSLHNEENSFRIWNKECSYDICRIFADYADFELYPDIIEKDGVWKYNKVVIRKIKEADVPQRDYFHILFHEMYDVYMKTMWDLTKEGTGNRIYRHREELCRKISDISTETLTGRIPSDRAVIYGFGKTGKLLFEKLKNSGLSVDVIDRNPVSYEGVRCFKIDEYEFNKNSFIVISVNYDEELIRRELAAHGAVNERIVNLSGLVGYMDWD